MADRKSTLTLSMIDGVSGPGARIRASLSGLGVSFGNLRGIMAGLGLAFGAAELARFGKEAVQRYAEHETGLLKLRQLFNVTGPEIEQAHKRMFAIAEQFGRPIEQVEAAMRVYAELGYTLPRAFESLPRAAKAADAMGASIAQVAQLEPLMRTAGVKNLDAAYNDLFETSKHVQGGFSGMEEGLKKLIPLLPGWRWGNDAGFRRLLATVEAVAPAVGGAANALEGFYEIMSKPGARRMDTAFKRAFGNDFSLTEELKKAVAAGRDPLARFMDLADQAIQKLGGVAAVFPMPAMQAWFKGLHAHMGEVRRNADGMAGSMGSMDKAVQQNAATTQRKIDQLSTSWDHFKEKLGETIVNAGAVKLLSELQRMLNELDERIEEMQKKGFWNVVGERGKMASERASGQAHEFVKMLDDLGRRKRAEGEGRTADQEAEDAKAREQGLLPERLRIPQPSTTSPAPAPPPPASAEPYLGRPMRRRMTPEQIERAVPPPPEPAPVDLSDALNGLPNAGAAAGTATGQAYNAGLGAELNRSVKMITEFTDWAAKALGFRATPQIAPSFATATGRQGPAARADSLGRGAFSDVGPVPVR